VYERRAWNILGVLSQIGGFKTAIFSIVVYFGSIYSENKFYSIVIGMLYFSKSLGRIDLKAKDGLIGNKKKLFIKAKKVIKNNLDVCNILMEINKMKAIINILVQEDKRILKKAKMKYMSMFEMDNYEEK
jgi:hypothetical protein